jgi:hypothetical protein
MNKKGTHVEVIISFVIFITFVMFLFAASRPAISKQEDKKNLLEDLEYKTLNMISEDVKIISVSVPVPAGNCVTLDTTMTSLDIGNRIIVKDLSGEIIENVHINGDQITIGDLTPSDTFFKIYYSQSFNPVSPAAACASANENIGFTKTKKYVFESEFRTTMNGDYDTLKTTLEVPEAMDFTFGMVLFNGTAIEKYHEEIQSNISTNIYAKDASIEYFNLNNELVHGYLRTKIW